MASRPQFSAATVAANGVDFFDPLNPAFPAEPHASVFPRMSVIVMSRLLNVAEMWAMPSVSTTFLARLALGVLAGAGTGAVITSWSLSSCRRWRAADPSWSVHWYGCVDPGPAGPGGGGCHGSSRC